MNSDSHTFGREFYPFLYAPTADDRGALPELLLSVRQSTLEKCADVIALRRELLAEYAATVDLAATRMAQRFATGGKLLVFPPARPTSCWPRWARRRWACRCQRWWMP